MYIETHRGKLYDRFTVLVTHGSTCLSINHYSWKLVTNKRSHKHARTCLQMCIRLWAYAWVPGTEAEDTRR